MQIGTAVDGPLCIIRLAGELDLAGVEELVDVLASATGAVVVVDLSELSFIDACGVSALLVARWRVLAEGRECLLRGAKNFVQRVFEILGVDELLG